MTTQAQAKAAIKALGMSVTVTDGEYRVTFPASRYTGLDKRTVESNREASAYYTDDADDAIGTAQAMSRELANAY